MTITYRTGFVGHAFGLLFTLNFDFLFNTSLQTVCRSKYRGSKLDGVDGGGYVVLKYTSSPNDDNDPSQNGIYEHGNTTNNGTDSLVGTVVFVGTETSFTDTYQAGNFYKIYAVDKAFNYSNEAVVSDAQLGLTDYSDLELKLFPNPTHSIFNIYINESEFSITIYNILGKMVLKSKNSKTINISNLKTGAYFVKISTDRGSLTKKIIKQ